MKSLRIIVSFVLPLVLVVSAAPRQDTQTIDSQDHFDADEAGIDTDVNLEKILEVDPSIIRQINPDVVRGPAWLDVEDDRHMVLEVLRRLTEEKEAEIEAATEETDEEKGNDGYFTHYRGKRQTNVTGGVNVDKQQGGRRITGNLNVDHALNTKHSIGGSFGIDHTKIKGVGSSRDYNAGLTYSFNPNKRTSLSLGASRSWGDSGRGTNFGVKFTHNFGRKRRSPDRIKIKCRSNGACKIKVRGRRLRFLQ